MQELIIKYDKHEDSIKGRQQKMQEMPWIPSEQIGHDFG